MPWNCHSQWRDAKAWMDYGLPMSTTSDVASKMFDATLTQYVGWYGDDSVGGIESSAQKMLEADTDFVLGHVLCNGLELMGTGRSPRLDPALQKDLDTMVTTAKRAHTNKWENMHVQAMELCGKGFMSEACLLWEDILVQHPSDILALKFAHDAYFYLGYQPQMRDSIARVLPHWKPDMPLYAYLMGMHSFGLCETNMFQEAEKVAREGLELNPRDAWSTHSLAHVLEMEGRANEGITFMSTTVTDWSSCGMLACHNFWHWAVYHIEKGEYQGALDIYDGEIGKRSSTSGAMLDIVDACSMLKRLEMQEVNVGDRWHDIYETCRPHIDDHILAFNDAHILMACLGNKQPETTSKMMQSLRDFVSNCEGTNHVITKEVGASLCEALVAYSEEDYAKAVDLLRHKRYKILQIGGSNAQRDVFSQFLISACLKSTNKQDNKLARHLLMERKALKENSPLTDRLIQRAMLQHVD